MIETDAYKQVLRMTQSPSASISKAANVILDPDITMEEKVRVWYEAMGLPSRFIPTPLSPEDIVLRLRLTLEEFKETVHATGCTIVSKETGRDIFEDLKIQPLIDGQQDHVETADGFGDQIAINIANAAVFGYPITAVIEEIMFSNFTKVPEHGSPLINRCIYKDASEEHVCDKEPSDCVLLDDSKQVGKILKPSTYVKANIAAILEHYQW